MTIRVAILGCGMMGQEHVSYMEHYDEIEVKFLCDPNHKMVDSTMSLIKKQSIMPEKLCDEYELMKKVNDIDLLVIASPNYLHTPQLLRWALYPICILVEKPVAISEKQVLALKNAKNSFQAKIWVAMEYRYIPAIQKLIQLLPNVGTIKAINIRENRYPFLTKIAEWNKDVDKSGDTLVEKCCHFFDLFRHLSGQEMHSCATKVQRGLLWDDYGYDTRRDDPVPIIDSAYVLLDFVPPPKDRNNMDGESKIDESKYPFKGQQVTLGTLELCMFAEGSRHQEEIIVTGMKGRIEAYLPENKVFLYKRPNEDEWKDRTKPPPENSIKEEIFNCTDLKEVYSFADQIPLHSGYHYCSTAVEWKYLIDAVKAMRAGEAFRPHVSLDDGIYAVEMGILSLKNVTNREDADRRTINPIIAFSSESSECLLNLALNYGLDKTNLYNLGKGSIVLENSSTEDQLATIGCIL